jgi:hypothetical protein
MLGHRFSRRVSGGSRWNVAVPDPGSLVINGGSRGCARMPTVPLRTVVPLVAALVLLAAPPAHAQVIERAAQALETDHVYVHPAVSSSLTRAELRELRERIDESPAGPIWIAVLPEAAVEEAGGSIEGTIVKLAGSVTDRRGIYGVAVPGEGFRAGSNGANGHPGTRRAAKEAWEANGNDIGPLLIDFVDDIGTLNPADADAAGDVPSGGSVDQRGRGSSIGIGAIILLAGGGLLSAAVLFAGRERRRLQDRSFQEAKDNARDDLIALGDDIRSLEADIGSPGASQAAIDDYSQAVVAYERAERAWKASVTPQELAPVSMSLEEARWAMASAKARLADDEPPVRRPPCFFDPRHGPSTRDVEWSPPWGSERMVPACEADAVRVERGEDPHAKLVMAGGRRVPYWNAGPAYGPFAGGFFGGAGAPLLPSILVGSMLGMSLGANGEPHDAPGNDTEFGDAHFGGGGFPGGDP